VVAWPQSAVEQLGGIDRATYLAVLTHDPKIDDEVLMLALRAQPAYIGAMGSKRAQAQRRERLLAAGVDEDDLHRISAPIGLDLGAVSSERSPCRSCPSSSRFATATGGGDACHNEAAGPSISRRPLARRDGGQDDEAAGTAGEGVVPAEPGESDAPRELLPEDPQLGNPVLGATSGSGEPAHRPFSRASASSGVLPPRCSLGFTGPCSWSLLDSDRVQGEPD